MKWIVENTSAILPDSIIEDAVMLVDDGIIRFIDTRAKMPSEIREASLPRLDAQGLYLSPGFIDQHVHGGGGSDFMDGTVEAIRNITAAHAKHGTTGLLATGLSGSPEETDQFLVAYNEAVQSNNDHAGAELLGIHMEGPYFSPQYAGAQDPAYLREPNPAEYEAWLKRSPAIKRWTIAPELPGAFEMAERLQALGIQVSAGHSAATTRQMLEALNHGFNQVTHFYSGMSGTHYINGVRSGGIIEAVYLSDEIKAELICDGVHLPAELLQLIRKIKHTDDIALITDAMRAAGEDTKTSILGSLTKGRPVIIEDRVAKLPDRSAMAGSIATTDRLVRTWMELTGSDLVEAVRLASLNPARFNKLDEHKGSLAVGKDADFLLFDEAINVELTAVRGRLVHQSNRMQTMSLASGLGTKPEGR